MCPLGRLTIPEWSSLTGGGARTGSGMMGNFVDSAQATFVGRWGDRRGVASQRDGTCPGLDRRHHLRRGGAAWGLGRLVAFYGDV